MRVFMVLQEPAFGKDKQNTPGKVTGSSNNIESGTNLTLNSIEALSKLEELIKFALDCEKQGGALADTISFVEIFKQLQEIQTSIKLLNEYQKETMGALADLAHQEGINLSEDIQEDSISQEDKKIIDKLQSLTAICEAARERIHKEIVQNPDVQEKVLKTIQDSSASDAKKQKRRKNKFRSLGQDGWTQI